MMPLITGSAWTVISSERSSSARSLLDSSKRGLSRVSILADDFFIIHLAAEFFHRLFVPTLFRECAPTQATAGCASLQSVERQPAMKPSVQPFALPNSHGRQQQSKPEIRNPQSETNPKRSRSFATIRD